MYQILLRTKKDILTSDPTVFLLCLEDCEVEGDWQVGLDPELVVLGQWDALRVDLLNVVVKVSHHLPVGEEHHLRAGHVEGVAPVPAAGQQVLETVELSLDYGVPAPLYMYLLVISLQLFY